MSEKKRNVIGAVLLGVFFVMMILGARNEEITVVFSKAVNICMECIGIG